jgi:hypothetical protein
MSQIGRNSVRVRCRRGQQTVSVAKIALCAFPWPASIGYSARARPEVQCQGKVAETDTQVPADGLHSAAAAGADNVSERRRLLVSFGRVSRRQDSRQGQETGDPSATKPRPNPGLPPALQPLLPEKD